MLMENSLLALRGSVALIPSRQDRTVSRISADDLALGAVRAFERNLYGLHELAGPDSRTFDEAYLRLARAWGTRISVYSTHPLRNVASQAPSAAHRGPCVHVRFLRRRRLCG